MKYPVTFWFLLLTGLAVLGFSPRALAQAKPAANAKTAAGGKPAITTIYVVRHAEKDSTSGADDPSLSALGKVRAEALSKALARHRPVALFTTETKRTRATLEPLATATGLTPQVYDAKRGHDLADRILKEYAGKSVVIVGHSNNVLSLIDDFGGTPPVDEIGENDYEYLFTVRVAKGMVPTVDMRGYGPERKPAKTPGKAAPKAAPKK